MTINDYQKVCLRTMPKYMTRGDETLLGLMGLNGEAGECIDLYKKTLFHGRALDEKHLAHELGDIAWYLAVSAHAIGYSLEDIFAMNIEKTRTRYPNGFSIESGNNRNTGDV